jgi:hypothetical protein
MALLVQEVRAEAVLLWPALTFLTLSHIPLPPPLYPDFAPQPLSLFLSLCAPAQRPENPVEWLGTFLIKNDPAKRLAGEPAAQQ